MGTHNGAGRVVNLLPRANRPRSINSENTPACEAGTKAGQLHAAHDEEEIMRTMTRPAGIATLLVIAVAVGFALPRTAPAVEPDAYADEEMGVCLV